MKTSDIRNLLRAKMHQRGQHDRNTNRISFTDYEVDALAAEVAAELSTRFQRPVMTFTRSDVLLAAATAGIPITTIDNGAGGVFATPVDAVGNDMYDRLHKVVDWAFTTVMQRLPEKELQQEQARES